MSNNTLLNYSTAWKTLTFQTKSIIIEDHSQEGAGNSKSFHSIHISYFF